MKTRILLALAAGALSSYGFGQTVTVDASLGSPDNVTTFNTLQAALASFATAGSTGGAGVNSGNVAANIINVAPGTPVVGTACVDAIATAGHPELLIMDGDITIQGQGGVRATLAAQNLAGNALNGGIVWRQDVNLTLNDMAIIPATSSAPNKLCYFRMTTNATNTTVTLNRCILTANNGSNAPVTTTGQDNPSLTTPAVPLAAGGDGVYLVATETPGGSLTGNFNDTIIASYAASGTSDGIITFDSGTTTYLLNCFCNVNAGSVIANAPRFGIQSDYGAVTSVNGTNVKPVVFRNIGADGIWLTGDTTGATQPTVANVNYANFFSVNGTPVKEQETSGLGFINTVTNTKISSATASGIALYSSATPPPYASSTVTISDVVVHDTGNGTPAASYDSSAGQIAAPTYNSANKSNRTVNVNNATLSGVKTGLVGVYNSGTGTFNVTNSLISTTGSNALTGGATGGAGTINQTSVTNGSVAYVNTTNPHAANFMVPVAAVDGWELF